MTCLSRSSVAVYGRSYSLSSGIDRLCVADADRMRQCMFLNILLIRRRLVVLLDQLQLFPFSANVTSSKAACCAKSCIEVVGRALDLTFRGLPRAPPLYSHPAIHRNTTRAGHSASHTFSSRRPRIPHWSLCIVAGATTNLKEAGSAATTD